MSSEQRAQRNPFLLCSELNPLLVVAGPSVELRTTSLPRCCLILQMDIVSRWMCGRLGSFCEFETRSEGKEGELELNNNTSLFSLSFLQGTLSSSANLLSRLRRSRLSTSECYLARFLPLRGSRAHHLLARPCSFLRSDGSKTTSTSSLQRRRSPPKPET